MRDRIWRGLRIALLAATVSLLFGSVAWGQSWGRDGNDRYDRRDDASDQTRVGGNIIFLFDVEVGEIAVSAAGDADFFRKLLGMVEQYHGTPALSGLQGTHQAGCAGANNNYICFHICSVML